MTAAAELAAELGRLSIADRLRLAANLIDDALAGRSDPRALTERARAITTLVDRQLMHALRRFHV